VWISAIGSESGWNIPASSNCDREKKIHIFERLCFADTFENFLASKFNTSKRFGLDGGEAIIPALKDAIDRASELGAHLFIIGRKAHDDHLFGISGDALR
jgi:2-oxoglutarate dehydrogenase complex dehydrogenase (E1) component-like enzyme